MKKIVPIAVILFVALFFGVPFITGKIAESETHNLANATQAKANSYGTFEVVKYDRGIRSSDAHYRFTPTAGLAGLIQSQDPIDLDCDIQHGFIGIDYQCKYKGEGNYSQFVAEELDGNDPFSIHGSISAFGELSQTYELEPINNLKIEDDVLNLPRALLTIKTNNELSFYKISGGSDAFQFQNEGNSLDVGELSFDGHIEATDTTFVGPFEMTLDKLSITENQKTFSLKDFYFDSLNTEHGENINSKANFKIASVKLDEGPVKSIEDLVGVFDISGLDAKALAEYQQLSVDMQQSLLASENAQTPQFDANLMPQMMAIFEKMLKPGLRFKMDLSAELDSQKNALTLDTSLNEKLAFEQMALFAYDPEQALKKVNINLDANLSNSLLNIQPAISGMANQSPMFKKTTDGLELSLKLGQTIELNGEKLSFAELQQKALQF